MPLRNQEIESLVGQTCVAVVYDSDIDIDFLPLLANLQGERYGLFTFEILAVETPGSLRRADVPGATSSDPWPNTLDESKSSSSIYDVWLEVLDPLVDPLSCVAGLVDVVDHEPDSCSITTAKVINSGTTLRVRATSDFKDQTFVTFSVDGPDKGGDEDVDPTFLEVPLTHISGKTWGIDIAIPAGQNLKGRRITVQSSDGCVYNRKIDR